jgi:predicted dehydrogenase
VLIGLVGCGRWGRHILRDLVTLGCDVVVVARSEESVARAREGGAARIVDAIELLDDVAGIVVATPIRTHAQVVEHALRSGVPVFCEKPLTADPDSASRLAELAPDRLFVMDKWRYHAGVARLREIACSEELGAVAGLRTVRVGWGDQHPGDTDMVWVLAPHDLCIGLEVLGEVLPASAAVGQRLGGALLSLSGQLTDGKRWHVVEVSSRAPRWERRVELHCERGVAVLADGWDQHVTIFRHDRRPEDGESLEAPGELPLLAELRAFVAHLDGGPPPRSSAAEGALVVRRIAELRRLAGAQ